jgi:hypothetical protein
MNWCFAYNIPFVYDLTKIDMYVLSIKLLCKIVGIQIFALMCPRIDVMSNL